MEELWKQTLEEIEIEISKPIFQMFFKGTNLLDVSDGIATIYTPSQMNSNYIEQRYYGVLKRIIEKKTGGQVSLLFVSNTPEKKPVENAGPLFAKELLQPQMKRRPERIRADYTFETFAVSESNQLAYTAAQAVAQDVGGRYNPLFIYGTVGVGKTHLMHAVANTIIAAEDSPSILYMTTEEFTNEVVEAIRDKTTSQMRKKFRNVRLLLLDDIQFLSGKERVQEELFHTFNTLIDKGNHVIFSADRPPHEIKKIEARLSSRFEGGLTVDVSAPDFELRSAILLIKSKKYNFDIPVETAKIIAEHITETRALEGFLLKIASVVSTRDDKEITPELVRSLLKKPQEGVRVIHPDTIVDTICDYYRIRPTQLKGNKRDAMLVKPRHMCMYLLKEQAGLTLVEIGNLLGGRDHTTVMHGVEKVEKLVENVPQMKEEISLITNKIKEENAL